MTILAPRYMFSRSRNLMVPFVLTYDLDLSRSWPLQNHVLGHISVINGQNVAKFLTQDSLCRGLSINEKYLWSFEHVMYANTLYWQPLCKKMSLTITFELKDSGWRFWCLELCFWGQEIRWCHLFCPMTLTFQGHDLWKITFLDIFQFLMGKMLPNFNTR